MDEIRDIKKAVYVREIVFAVLNGEYTFPVKEIDAMEYEELYEDEDNE